MSKPGGGEQGVGRGHAQAGLGALGVGAEAAQLRQTIQPRLDRQLFRGLHVQRQPVDLGLEDDRQEPLQRRQFHVDLDVGHRHVARGQGDRDAGQAVDAARQIDGQGTFGLADPAEDLAVVRRDGDVEIEQARQLAHGQQGIVRVAIGRQRVGQGQSVQVGGQEEQVLVVDFGGGVASDGGAGARGRRVGRGRRGAGGGRFNRGASNGFGRGGSGRRLGDCGEGPDSRANER